MKNLKKLNVLLLVMALLIGTMAVPSQAQAKSKKKVKLNKTSVTLTVGKSTTLKLKNAPKGKKISWSSNKKKVATVKKGKVTAKKAGKAKITAKVAGKKYTCTVTVQSKKTAYMIKNEVLPAYQKYIDKEGESFEGCALIYINGDTIPELYVSSGYNGSSILAYCSKTGKLTSLAGGYSESFAYRKKKGIVFDYAGMHTTTTQTYYKLAKDGSKFKKISEASAVYNDSKYKYEQCKIDGKKVSEQAFKKYDKKYGKLSYMWEITLFKTVEEAYKNVK